MPLDTLVVGRIATFSGDHGFGWVEAVGIKDGRIAFAGSAVDLESRADPFTRRLDLAPGELAIPGLTDAHLHLADAALASEEVDLAAAPTIDDGLALIAEAHRRLPDDAWLLGGGWDQRRWGGWPTSDVLAVVAPGRKVAIWSFDHHAIWASDAALAVGVVGAATDDPDGGMIRRANDGRPEGVLLENACALVMRHVPPPSEETLERTILGLSRRLLAFGVVAVHDPGHVSADATLRSHAVYARLADAGDLPLHVLASIRSEALPATLASGRRSGSPLGEDQDGLARLGWLKLFADGTLGSGTAALLAAPSPADGHEGTPEGGHETGRDGTGDRGGGGGARGSARRSGVWLMPPTELAALAEAAASAAIASQIHAIGDAAVRAALDALEPTVSRVPFMPRVEHVQLCDPADRARFAAGGIAASVQPVHLREDAASARREWGARAEEHAYAWRSLVESGAILAFGTDAPVEPIDPWPGIALSVLRRDPSWGPGAEPFGPGEALTLEDALRAACVGPPTTARERDRGRLTPGSVADLVVLPPWPELAEAAEAPGPGGGGARVAPFARVTPRLVLVGGEVAWEA